MSRPKGVKNKVSEEVVPVETPAEEVKTIEPLNEVPVQEVSTRTTFTYPVPETREDLLALHKCLQDTGVNSIGDLEVKASRM